jgi:hypothetical protein
MKRLLFFGSLWVSCVVLTHAQILLNQSELIFVGPNTDFCVKGNFQNQGKVINRGTISVSGDWMNGNKYFATTGNFILNGDLAQTVRHNKDSFHVLVLNGLGEKILQEEAEIVKDVSFSNSLLTTQAAGALIVRNGGTITGASSSGYVNGLLVREGIGLRDFPIGKGGKFLPLTLTSVDGSSDVLLGVEIKEPNTGAQPGATLKSVSQLRYAELSTRKGTFAGSPITLSIAPDEDQNPPQDLVVAEATTQNGVYRNLGQFGLNGTKLTSSFLVTGSFFAIALSEALDENSIFIPNALAPSSSNPEEQTIKIYGDLLAPEEFEFIVFSKWGSVLFESNSLTQMKTTGWNGLFKDTGELVSLGVYTFKAKGKFLNGKVFEKTGNITLIR